MRRRVNLTYTEPVLPCPVSGGALGLAQRPLLAPRVVVVLMGEVGVSVVRGQLVLVWARGRAAAPFGLRRGALTGVKGRRGPRATQGGLQGAGRGQAAFGDAVAVGGVGGG